MKTKLIFISILSVLSLLCSSCRRNSSMMWEDTKSAGRHVNRGFRSLGGKHTDSRQISSRAEFMPLDEMGAESGEWQEMPYIPLNDDPNADTKYQGMHKMYRPPKEAPGEVGSSIPGIEAFRPATSNASWSVFKNVHFDYNSNLVKGEENVAIVQNVSEYMRKHPETYVFIEGHCDERGPEAYNYALGSNRSNSVRNMLINEGVNPDNVFTISYGKDRPLIPGHDDETWQQNRRAEFKIYER